MALKISITPFKVQFESLRADNLHVSSGYKPVGVSINLENTSDANEHQSRRALSDVLGKSSDSKRSITFWLKVNVSRSFRDLISNALLAEFFCLI